MKRTKGPPGLDESGRGPRQETATATQITISPAKDYGDSTSSFPLSGSLSAQVEWYEPAGRRGSWAAVVRSCPKCQSLHLHRFSEPVYSALRRGSCGVTYLLVSADVLGVAS